MRTSSVSTASVSSVALTDPSSEFSMGTKARSTEPPWTAMIASCSVGSRVAGPSGRVLEGDEGAIAGAAVAGHDRVVQRRERRQLVAALPRHGHQGLVAERALGAQVGDPHQPDAEAAP